MEKIYPILDSIQASYRGRIPSRSDGKKRRNKILAAVRKIIIEKGVHGVKHRAIAKLAEVPLAATTYYFPDIQALLHDAFLDFYECNILQLQKLENDSQALIKAFDLSSREAVDDLYQITTALSTLVYQHVKVQVTNRNDRIIERAFRNESIRNPELAELVNKMELQQLNAIAQFLKLLGSDNPDSDSRELMAVILFLEQSLLAQYVSNAEAQQTVERLINRLLS